jgi:uncharacterized short protein YbdD (DUF466 family)
MNQLKKASPYLLIVIFVGWFSYKFFVERKVPQQPKMALDWDELDATSGSKPQEVPATIKKDSRKIEGHSAKVEKLDDDEFKAFDEMEHKWLTSVEALFGPSVYTKYLNLRKENEKEKALAYKEYHEYLRKKFGDKFTYNISEDQSVREKQINQRYLKELLLLVGADKFQKYLKARDVLNEENRKNNKEFIQIEF